MEQWAQWSVAILYLTIYTLSGEGLVPNNSDELNMVRVCLLS